MLQQINSRRLDVAFLFLCVGIGLGFWAGTNYIASRVYGIRQGDFYKGMYLFCTLAPAPPGSEFVNQYSERECRDMVAQGQKFDYFGQSLTTPAPAQEEPEGPQG